MWRAPEIPLHVQESKWPHLIAAVYLKEPQLAGLGPGFVHSEMPCCCSAAVRSQAATAAVGMSFAANLTKIVAGTLVVRATLGVA